MTVIFIIVAAWCVYKIANAIGSRVREEKRQKEAERIRRELREAQQRAKEEAARMVALEREQARQAKEQERIAKEQKRQAAAIAKHEEMIRKLEMRMATAESELAYNREQRDRLFLLLDIEERERDAAIEGSATWQKHQRKVISLENQIHAVQKRIDKAHMDKAYCESKLGA